MDEVFKTLFRLTEQIALLTAGLKNVEGSLMKVEEYQSRMVEDNQDSKRGMYDELRNLRSTLDDLTAASEGIQKAIKELPEEITASVKEDHAKTGPCKVCDEKDSAIEALKKEKEAVIASMSKDKADALADLRKDKKWLAIVAVIAIVLALTAFGANFEPIRQLLGWVKGGGG